MVDTVNIDGIVADAQVAFNVKFEQGTKAYQPSHVQLGKVRTSS